jgi:adenylosuccinate lyase
MESWSKGVSFVDLLKADSEVSSHVSDAALEDMFDLGYHIKNVDAIFKRVFG